MTDILMPALSPALEEGTLAKWSVEAGNPAKIGEVIASLTHPGAGRGSGAPASLGRADRTGRSRCTSALAGMSGDGEATS